MKGREVVALRRVPVAWNEAIEMFISVQHAAGKSPRTVKTYTSYLRGIARFCPDLDAIREDDLIAWLSATNWSAHARKSARTVAGIFFAWAARTGRVDGDPATYLPTVHTPKGNPRPLPDTVFQRALKQCTPSDRLMMRLGRFAGLRASEIAAVHTDDLVDDVLTVVGKGQKVRQIPIPMSTLRHEIRAANGWLFPSPRGGHVTGQWVSVRLSSVLGGEWTAHNLRHAYACAAVAGGGTIEAISALLGHSKLDTTMIYTAIPDASIRAAASAAVAA